MNVLKFSEVISRFLKFKVILRNIVFVSSIFTLQSAYATPFTVSNSVDFSQPTLVGTVFFDKNSNGYFDQGEKGIPAVRLFTVEGLLIETDGFGRFHIPYSASKNSKYLSNQLIKIDIYSLPLGSRVTTENPRLIKLTNTALNKINFGVVY